MAVACFLWRALLCHVGIDFRQFGGSFRGYVVEGGCGCGEKGVVESDKAAFAAVVGVQVADVGLVGGHFFVDMVQDAPVAVPPTVDALFHVAHDEVAVSRSHAFLQQHFEVFPLHGRRVLEFINHDVVDVCAHLFVDERRILVFN